MEDRGMEDRIYGIIGEDVFEQALRKNDPVLIHVPRNQINDRTAFFNQLVANSVKSVPGARKANGKA